MVGSAKSSSGHRNKRQRPPDEAPPSPRAGSPPPPKRCRSVFEQEDDTATPTVEVDETMSTPIPDEDEDGNKENVVEARVCHEPTDTFWPEDTLRFVSAPETIMPSRERARAVSESRLSLPLAPRGTRLRVSRGRAHQSLQGGLPSASRGILRFPQAEKCHSLSRENRHRCCLCYRRHPHGACPHLVPLSRQSNLLNDYEPRL